MRWKKFGIAFLAHFGRSLMLQSKNESQNLTKQEKMQNTLCILKGCLTKNCISGVAKQTNREHFMVKYIELNKRCISSINKYNSGRELALVETGNLGSFFKYVNSKTSYKSCVAPLKDSSSNLLETVVDKVRLLNQYFASTFTINNGILPSFERLGFDSSSNKLNSVYFSTEKVMKAIKNLKNTGSGGEDKLPNIFFKNVALEISFPLSCIVNLSMSASCIPTI